MIPPKAVSTFIWFVLLPLTLIVWAQFLPPCTFGCARTQQHQVFPLPPLPPKSYTVCSIAGAENCWNTPIVR